MEIHRIVDLAVGEARRLNHQWLGRDHILLALLHPDSAGHVRSILEGLGLSLESQRRAFADALGDPFEDRGGQVEIPPASLVLIERARRWQARLADDQTYAEHVLLALADDWNQVTPPPSAAEGQDDHQPEVIRTRAIAAAEARTPTAHRRAQVEREAPDSMLPPTRPDGSMTV
jgi:ATP-dependent Clp protease ATP-binding subunit ClpA